jgi:predicted dehydrogenase
MEGSETPDMFTAVYEFPRMMADWTLNYANSYQNGWSITLMGDEATMILDDAGFSVYKEPWKDNPEPVYKVKMPVPIEPHIQNFLDCIRTRKEPTCPVEIGMKAVAGPHLANLAHKQGKRVKLGADNVTVS